MQSRIGGRGVSDIEDLIAQARDTITVRRVFGDPLEKDGVTLVPAAVVRGCSGVGEGEGGDEQPSGRGGGFGVSARPVGAYRIKDGDVTWIPAADTTRVIVLALTYLFLAVLLLRKRRVRRSR
jgi:uncharacterized spore protein YtfJ